MATLIGGIISIIGIFYLNKGLSGTSFLISGSGLRAKLVNASPGLIVCLIGALIIYFSLNSGGEYRFDRKIDIFNDKRSQKEILDDWLSKLGKSSCEWTYSEVFRNIFYTAQFQAVYFPSLEKDITLGNLSKEKLGDSKYWQLIAIVNKDRGNPDDCYFPCDSISEKTVIKKGCGVEVVAPSRYRYSRPIRTYEDFRQMRASSLVSFYDLLLNYAIDNKPFYETFLEVKQKARDEELSLASIFFDSDGDTTLSELSSFYYEDNKYWQIIKWANSDDLPEEIKQRDILPLGQTILIPYFLP
ncbi:MAG: hypothetical protein WBM44_26495 [Waterburya sp.]